MPFPNRGNSNSGIPALGAVTKRPGMVALPATASTSPGGWSVDAGATLSLVPSALSPSGFATRVQCPVTGATTVTMRRKITKTFPVSFSGKVSLRVKPGPLVGNITINTVLSSDIPAADPPTVTPANRASYLWQPSQWRQGFDQVMGVNLTAPAGRVPDLSTNFPADPTTAFPLGQPISITGAPDLYNYHQIQLVLFFPAGVAAADMYMDIGDIMFDENATPFIMFGFDGAGEYPSHRQLIRPLFDEFGIPCAFSPQGQVITSVLDELMTAYADGHDVTNEGFDHINYANNPTRLVPDFVAARDLLNSFGMRRASSIATMPNNAILSGLSPAGDGAKQLFDLGFIGIRASNKWSIPVTTGGKGAPIFGAYGIDKCSTAEMTAQLEGCIINGESTLYLGHDATQSTTPSNLQVTMGALYGFLPVLMEAQAQGLCRVGSMSQFYKEYF